jgi:dihydrofolate reductase
MQIALVGARDENSGIGKDGSIPWKCKADLDHFKRITTSGISNALLMGRRTYESLPRKLSDRLVIVLSRNNSAIDEKGVLKASSIKEALTLCRNNSVSHVWICGGAKVYEKALELRGDDSMAACYVTDIKGSWKCDVFFPELRADKWEQAAELTLSESACLVTYIPKRNKDYQ